MEPVCARLFRQPLPELPCGHFAVRQRVQLRHGQPRHLQGREPRQQGVRAAAAVERRRLHLQAQRGHRRQAADLSGSLAGHHQDGQDPQGEFPLRLCRGGGQHTRLLQLEREGKIHLRRSRNRRLLHRGERRHAVLSVQESPQEPAHCFRRLRNLPAGAAVVPETHLHQPLHLGQRLRQNLHHKGAGQGGRSLSEGIRRGRLRPACRQPVLRHPRRDKAEFPCHERILRLGAERLLHSRFPPSRQPGALPAELQAGSDAAAETRGQPKMVHRVRGAAQRGAPLQRAGHAGGPQRMVQHRLERPGVEPQPGRIPEPDQGALQQRSRGGCVHKHAVETGLHLPEA